MQSVDPFLPVTGETAPEPAPADTSSGASPQRARRTLAAALAAGGVTEALFFRAGTGLNWLLFSVAAVGVTLALFGRRPIPKRAWLVITGCLALGVALVVHESEWTLTIALPASAALLALLPALLGDSPLALFDIFVARFTAIPNAVEETVSLPGRALSGDGARHARGLALGTLVGAPIAMVFTLLFLADSHFSAAIARIAGRSGDVIVFAVEALVAAIAFIVWLALERRAARPAPDDVQAANGVPPYRIDGMFVPPMAAIDRRPRFSRLTWGIVLGQVSLVFGLFVAVNATTLTASDAIVRSKGGPTYATYLHSGFVELLIASALAVCLVLLGHRFMRPRGEPVRAGEPAPGGTALSAIESVLVLLAGVTLVSCCARLRIYVLAYGATYERLGVAFIAIGLFGVLALTLGKALLRRWNGYGPSLLALTGAVVVAAGVFNADEYIARTNLDRAADGMTVDTSYLASLSPDACRVLNRPEISDTLRDELIEHWSPRKTGDWRSFRGLGRCSALSPRHSAR